mmetsp:Transcript_19341/g.60821  ORF Transcript_19341/g.60821 Transcript_19341/m.60821 type:complete len:201 (-) Transcript_19341:463-1065(-)
MGLLASSSGCSPYPMPSVRMRSARPRTFVPCVQKSSPPSCVTSGAWERMATSPSMTTSSCAGSPGQAMISPGSNRPSSAELMMRCCCSSVMTVKIWRWPLGLGSPCNSAFTAHRRSTSFRWSLSPARELLARARQVTLPLALKPIAWRLPYTMATAPMMTPALSYCSAKRSSIGTALPLSTANIHSPTSPSRRMTSPSRK